jgi:hypothetical protein
LLGSSIALEQSLKRHGDGLQTKESSDNNILDRSAAAQPPTAIATRTMRRAATRGWLSPHARSKLRVQLDNIRIQPILAGITRCTQRNL